MCWLYESNQADHAIYIPPTNFKLIKLNEDRMGEGEETRASETKELLT